jgi:hypothetical protein
MGILDTIITTNQQESLQQFELGLIVGKILEPLREREQSILKQRYGLQGHNIETLKTVGEEQSLTRERVRQIEKELLKNLKRGVQELEAFTTARDLLLSTIGDHGGIMAEHRLMKHLGAEDESDINALRFLLNLIVELEVHNEDKHIRHSWAKLGFDKTFLTNFIVETKRILAEHGKPLDAESFLKKFMDTKFYQDNRESLPEHVMLNYLHAATGVHKNSFGEFGLQGWSEIKPKDVGDKAYLVMKHHGKPEHYSVITELINKQGLDKRTAYKETVHNKLIKDDRFVLVGRGIYALTEWGYKPGVVSDILTEVLKAAGSPLGRDEIIDQVMKRRMVKKNTILVGLSNRKLFKKVGKNLYDLA